MKTLLFCLMMTIFYYSSNNNEHEALSLPQSKTADSSHPVIFKTDIQPVFVSHCSPCHFPGGKMYENLPFDKPETIVDHEAGILKRIKDEKETALIKEFVARQKKSMNK